MKKMFFAIMVFVIFLFSCKNGMNDEDEYYVKYEVSSQGPYIITLYAEITNENNGTSQYSNQYEIIIGPVKKGFTARLKSYYTSEGLSETVYGKISVSKNDGPFALKQSTDSNSKNNTTEMSYTIDF